MSDETKNNQGAGNETLNIPVEETFDASITINKSQKPTIEMVGDVEPKINKQSRNTIIKDLKDLGAIIEVTPQTKATTSNVKPPTIEQEAIVKVTPRLEQSTAFIKQFIADSAKAVEVKPAFNGQHAFSSKTSRASIGLPTVNEALDSGRDVDEFKAHLEKALERGRVSSSSKKMLDLAKNAANAGQPTLTMDVENTFTKSKNGQLLSASYKPSGGQQTTLINEDFAKLGKENIAYWKKQGNVGNQQMMEQVVAKLHESYEKAMSGDTSFQVVSPTIMKSRLAGAVNANPKAIIQGVNFGTDAKKITDFMGSATPETESAVTALIGNSTTPPRTRSLETQFRRRFQLPSMYSRGQSVTAMADMLGVLPKSGTSELHGSNVDVEVSENIGAILDSLDSHEASYGRDNSTKPSPIVNALQKRVNKPGFVEGWRGRTAADAAVKRLTKIQSGVLYASPEDAALEAHSLIESTRSSNAGSLLDLTAPTTNVQSDGLTLEQKKKIAKEQYGAEFTGKPEGIAAKTLGIAKEQSKVNRIVPLTGESIGDTASNLDAVMKRYALQATDNLRVKAMANGGRIDAAAIDQELVNLTKGLNTDFGPSLRNDEGHYPGDAGLTGTFEHLLTKFPSKTFVEDTKGQIGFKPENAATLSQMIFGKIRNGIGSKDVHLASVPLSIDTAVGGYLSPEVLETPLTQNEAIASHLGSNERAVGLKAISGHIFEGITKPNEPSMDDPYGKKVTLKTDIDRKKIATEILEAQQTGSFKPDLAKHLLKPDKSQTQIATDMISALEELRSKRYMTQGNVFEQSVVSGEDKFLSENGYTPVPNKFTGKLEHEGKIGNLTGGAEDLVGHPDLLASRVEKRGTGWQRRYTLADVKSPQTPVASGSTLSSLIEDKDRGKWLSQVLTYAQMLPEDIRKNLDIGILAGGPGQKTRMIKDSYENISQHPIAKEIISQLQGGTQGQVGKLESLPDNYLKPGETNKKNFTHEELNHVARVSDTSTKAAESYIKAITDIAKSKKVEGSSVKDLLIQYDTKGLNGNDASPLKARLDALQKTHNVEGGLFGKLPENDFNALSLSLLHQTANTDKSKRVSGLEDAVTNPQLKALDSVTTHFKGFELQIQEAQKKADTVVQTKIANLEGYRFNLGEGGANFFRGAFASEGVRGHKGDNKDLRSLAGDWQEKPAPEGPGAQAFEDAERRARLAKVYLNRYNSADTRTQMLVHGGEAKLAAQGTSGDTSFLQEFMAPVYQNGTLINKRGNKKDKTVTYNDLLDRGLQERAYYGTQLDTLSESKSMDDALVKLNASRQEKKVSSQALGLDQASSLLLSMNGLTGKDKGFKAAQYEQVYSKLQQSGLSEKELTQIKLPTPTELHEANKGDLLYNQGLQGSRQARDAREESMDAFRFATSGPIAGDEYDSLLKKRSRLTLNKKVSEHAAGYIESTFDTPESKTLADEKRKSAEKAGMEEAALNDFLMQQGSTQKKESRFHTPVSALHEVEGNREDLYTKHVNNALMAQEEASKFGLTPKLLDTLGSSITGIQSLGGSSAEHGIDLAKLLAGTKIKGFTGSSILNKLEEGATGEQSYTDKYLHANKQETYINSLHSELGSLTGDIKVDTPFKELGIAIEEDLQKLRTLKDEAKGLDHTSPEFAKNKLARTVVEDRLTDNLTQIKTADSGHTPGPDYSKEYEQQKGLRTAKAMDSSAMLAAALGADDFSPELLKSINKQNKVNTSLGITDPGLQASEVFSHYQSYMTDPNKRKEALENVDLSNNALKFTASAQVVGNYKANPSQVGTSDINVFDALHQKEQSALKVVNDLRTALIEVGGTKLTGLEDQFMSLYKNIEVSIAELQQLEAVGSQAPEHKQLLQDKRTQIAGQIDELDTTRQQIVQKRPTLDANAWNAMKVQAGTQSTIDEYDVVRKAMSANAKIQSLGERASYSDFKEAHDTAKELRQRNIPVVNNPGLMTEKEIEQHASKSGKSFFEGQQHVNFTEQLVDLANWQVQWAGATAVTQGFTTALYGGFGAAKEFEASMRDVELISQATSVQMDGLKNKVMELGSNFKVPVKELAEGLIILGQAGYKASDAVQMIQPISQLAVATGSSHKQASDITTSVMMAYDQPSTSTSEVTNTLAATAIESKLELGSLGTTFNYIGATAAMAGLSLEETATAMGLMSNAGVRASTIGTSLRSILGALIAPTANFKAELGRVGVSIDELNPRTNNMGAILGKLNSKGFSVENAFEGMNKREAGAMTSLLNQGDKWGDFKGKISGTDRAEVMAVGQMDTYDAQMKRLENQTKIAGVKVFQGSMDPLKTSAKVMSFGFETIGDLADTSFGKATTSIMSTALAAMTATTVISTLGKALMLVAPAAGAGIGKAWGMGDVGKLPEDPRRRRIYEGVQSLAGIGLNPWAVGAAVGLTTAAYVGQKMYNGDKVFGIDTNTENKWLNPFNQGIAPLKRETGKADILGNLLETVTTASKQQPDAELFDKGNDSERKSYISSLVNTGLLSGTDRFGKLVDPEMVRSHKGEPAKDLVVNNGRLDLKEFAAGMTSYSDFAVTPTLLKQVAKTGNNQITKQDDLYSEKGKNYVQFASDKYIEAMRNKNIFYNKQESGAYLDQFLGGSISDEAIKSSIREKQDIAFKANDRPDIEKSSNKEFFKRSAATAFGIQEILDRPDSKIAITRKAASEKTFIEGELNNDEVKATLKEQKPYRDIIGRRKAAYDKAINTGDTTQISEAQDKLLTAMETLSQVQGLESFAGVKKRAGSSLESQFSPKALKAANETMSQAYTRVITDSPELAKSKGEYSTAGEQFNEKKVKGVVEYGDVLRKLKEATDDLKATEAKGGTDTDEYKTKQLQVRAYQMHLEELGASMKRLQMESYKFGMSEVNYKLIPTILDLKYPAKFANEKPISNLMQYMPTIAIDDFRQKSVGLEKKYLPLKDQAMIAGDYKATARVDLAWKLEIQDLEEELIAKATVKVKEAGDKLEGIITREFQNRTLNIQLKTDIATTEIDMKASEAKMASLLAPREILKGQQKEAAVDYTKYGYPNYQPYPGVQAWSKNASMFDTSKYSADVGFTDTITAEMDKLKLSKGSNVEIMNAALEAASATRLQGIKTAYGTTAPGMAYNLPQTPAEAVESGNAPEATKLKLIDVEEKYQQARISASSKALQSIRKDIEAEMKLRDQLLEKMKGLDDSKNDFAKGVDSRNKELRKAAGLDVRERPEQMMTDMNDLISKAKGYAKEGKVDKVKEIDQQMAEKSRALATDEYGSYWRMEGTKKNDQMVPIYNEAVANRKAIYGDKVEQINRDITNDPKTMNTWASSIRDSIKSSSGLSEEEKSIRTKNFDERLSAAGSDPEKMKQVLAAERAHSEIAGETTGAEAFKNLTASSEILATKFNDLIPILDQLLGMTGKTTIGQDVTPSKASIKDLIGETAYKQLGLDAIPESSLPTMTRRQAGSIKGPDGKTVQGQLSEDGKSLEYTDSESLKHELRHVVQKAKGVPYDLHSMQAEYDADNAAGLSNETMLRKYNLPRGLDAGNLTSEQQTKLNSSKMARIYKNVYSLSEDSDVQGTIDAQREPLAYTSSANKAFGTGEQGVGTPYTRTISRVLHTVLPPALATVGAITAGAAATPETLAVGTIPAGVVGAGLGWSGGKTIARGYDNWVGIGQNQSIPRMLATSAYDVAEGMTYEMGGQVLGKGIEVATPYAKQLFKPAINTYAGAIEGRLFGRASKYTETPLYHGGKLAKDTSKFDASASEPLFVTPSQEFAAAGPFGGKPGSGVVELTLDKSAKVLDTSTATGKVWNDLRQTLRSLTQTNTRTGRPIRSDWKNDLGAPSRPLTNPEGGLPVEPGYAYRTVSEAEAKSLAEEGVLTPSAKFDNVAVGTANKGHKQATKKMWSQFDRQGTPYSQSNVVLRVPVDKVSTVPGQMVRAEDVQVMRFSKQSGAWEASPGARSTESYVEDTINNIKLGNWRKAEKGLGRKAIEAQGYDAVTMAEGMSAKPLPNGGIQEFNPRRTLAVFNKSKIKGMTTKSLTPEGITPGEMSITGNDGLMRNFNDLPEETAAATVKEVVSPSRWEKLKNLSPGKMLQKLKPQEQAAVLQNATLKSGAISAYLGIPPVLSAMFGEKPKKELTPEEQLKETETRGMDNARKTWAENDQASTAKYKAKEEAKEAAKQKENTHQAILNPALMAEGTFDEMRSKMETQQRPYDILAGDDKQYKGKGGLKKYFTDMGLSKSEVKTRVQETIDTAGQKDEGQIKSGNNITGPGLKPNGGIIDNVLSAQDTPEMAKWKADNAPQKGSLTLGLPDSLNEPFLKARGKNLTPEELAKGKEVTPASAAIDQVNAAIKAPYGSLAADSNPYSSMAADYNPYSSMSADLPKTAAQVNKKVYSLGDQAPQGNLATLTNQTMQTPGINEAQAASNEKLIASLDQLRSAVEKISGNASATQGSTTNTNGGVSVQVNAPITVATSTNNGGGTQDVSATVTKICTEFFNNEFTNRYVAAVNNTSVS